MFQCARFNHSHSASTVARFPSFATTTLAALSAAACMLLSVPAAAQGATSAAISTGVGNPSKACTDGTTNEDRTTCLKEAGAAKLEAQRGNLTNPASAADPNALQRCDVLPASDKQACRLRIMGAGTTSGSVAGGGIIREVTTVVPNSPMPMPAAESAPAPVPVVTAPGK